MTALKLTGLADSAARRVIVQACRILKANGHDDYIWGHVSVRDKAGRGFWMKSSGLGFEEVTEDDVILIGPAGNVLQGDRPRHSEWPIHSEIMAADATIGAVVHTHPPHAIALAAAGLDLRPVSHAGTLFTPPAVQRFDLTANLINDQELGRALACTLGAARAAFLVNHGIVTTGATLQEAVVHAILLEKACSQQLLAQGPGTPISWPDAAGSVAKRETVWPPAHLDALWNYLLRTLPPEGGHPTRRGPT